MHPNIFDTGTNLSFVPKRTQQRERGVQRGAAFDGNRIMNRAAAAEPCADVFHTAAHRIRSRGCADVT